jgi:hypothetical protein
VGFDVLWPQMWPMVLLAAAVISLSIFRFHKALD